MPAVRFRCTFAEMISVWRCTIRSLRNWWILVILQESAGLFLKPEQEKPRFTLKSLFFLLKRFVHCRPPRRWRMKRERLPDTMHFPIKNCGIDCGLLVLSYIRRCEMNFCTHGT